MVERIWFKIFAMALLPLNKMPFSMIGVPIDRIMTHLAFNYKILLGSFFSIFSNTYFALIFTFIHVFFIFCRNLHNSVCDVGYCLCWVSYVLFSSITDFFVWLFHYFGLVLEKMFVMNWRIYLHFPHTCVCIIFS